MQKLQSELLDDPAPERAALIGVVSHAGGASSMLLTPRSLVHRFRLTLTLRSIRLVNLCLP